MRCSSSYIKFYFTWVLDGWHSIKAQTSCFHEMKCSQINYKLHLNKKKTRRNERSEMQSSSERIVSFVQVFLINMYTCFKSVFDSETQSNGIQENFKGWCWWIKIVLFCFFDSDRLISSFKFAFCLFINYANICTWIGKNSTEKGRSLGKNHVVWNWNKERKLKCSIVEQRPRPHYVHTYPDILNPQLFLSGYGFPAHVSGESCSLSTDVTRSSPVLYREYSRRSEQRKICGLKISGYVWRQKFLYPKRIFADSKTSGYRCTGPKAPGIFLQFPQVKNHAS